MLIGGLQKLTLIDFPDKVAATIFTQGCNFRCPYCHNPELVDPQQFNETIHEDEIFAFLEKRKDKLSGIVISGGEPTIQDDLIVFIEKIKVFGFAVKLDTNGSRPEVLKKIIDKKLVDYIAMDVKAPLAKYSRLAGVKGFEDRIKESVSLIIKSDINHEFRTTVVESLLSKEDISEISKFVKGGKFYRLNDFVKRDKLLDPKFDV